MFLLELLQNNFISNLQQRHHNLVAPLFTKETTPVSHVRKASKTPFGVHLANVVSKPWRELLEQALEP